MFEKLLGPFADVYVDADAYAAVSARFPDLLIELTPPLFVAGVAGTALGVLVSGPRSAHGQLVSLRPELDSVFLPCAATGLATTTASVRAFGGLLAFAEVYRACRAVSVAVGTSVLPAQGQVLVLPPDHFRLDETESGARLAAVCSYVLKTRSADDALPRLALHRVPDGWLVSGLVEDDPRRPGLLAVAERLVDEPPRRSPYRRPLARPGPAVLAAIGRSTLAVLASEEPMAHALWRAFRCDPAYPDTRFS